MEIGEVLEILPEVNLSTVLFLLVGKKIYIMLRNLTMMINGAQIISMQTKFPLTGTIIVILILHGARIHILMAVQVMLVVVTMVGLKIAFFRSV